MILKLSSCVLHILINTNLVFAVYFVVAYPGILDPKTLNPIRESLC